LLNQPTERAMQRETFRKTDAGHTEVRSRARGLDARTRTLLILANGELSVAELCTRVGFDPLHTLLALAADGLLEPVPAPAPSARAAAIPAPPVVAAPPAAAPPPEVDPAAAACVPNDLPAARTRAVTVLAPHYGPDAVRMAEPLRAAATPEQFAAALAGLRATLSAHMGRKLAERLARAIAHGS
jgi:hypothetical protein